MKWMLACPMLMAATAIAQSQAVDLVTPVCRAVINIDTILSTKEFNDKMADTVAFTVEHGNCDFLTNGAKYQSDQLRYAKQVAMKPGTRMEAWVGKGEYVTDTEVMPYAQYQIMSKENKLLLFFQSGYQSSSQPAVTGDDMFDESDVIELQEE